LVARPAGAISADNATEFKRSSAFTTWRVRADRGQTLFRANGMAPTHLAAHATATGRITMPASQTKPIDLYYWPTPNGWKISIMLEECGLPYSLIPVNIGKGDQFKPEFLAISPNNRMPAIVDPEGPGGKPISVFESGAILQYLGRKTGKFYPADERGRVEVDQWLFWQMGGFGPMLGQTHHFRLYAPEKIPYAVERYTNEANRLYGVLNKRLAGRDFIAGDYSIADMACIGWALGWERQGQDLKQFPNVADWIERLKARPAVQRGLKVAEELRKPPEQRTPEEHALLFNQKAR
jgi:GSH-dependent disulfide-bond oxidoreductase